MDFLKSDHMRTVLRSKGFFWIASRNDMAMNWSLAGHVARVSRAGTWLAATPDEHWPRTEQVADYLEQYWQEPFGDRRQELVFIGMRMPKADMLAQLQAALLTEAELALGEAGWMLFPDDFPVWQTQTA
jgi:Putative GTPases (G3E family)